MTTIEIVLRATDPEELCACASRNEELDPPPPVECHWFCPVCHAPVRRERFDRHLLEVHGHLSCTVCGCNTSIGDALARLREEDARG